MKVAVICNSDSLAFPSIKKLHSEGNLVGIGILKRYQKHLEPALLSFGISKESIVYFEKKNWVEEKMKWLNHLKIDAVLVFCFPWKFPKQLLEIPKKGFYNFHFGLFPKYKGADPIFWQIKNKESKGGLIIHQVTEEIDAGDICWREEVDLIPGETHGLHAQKMGFVAANVINRFFDDQSVKEINQNSSFESAYLKVPTKKDVAIDWEEQSADEIEFLVNACNKKYRGASTILRGNEVRILELSPITLDNAPAMKPGTIAYADALYGLIVACKNDQYLRVMVLSTHDAILSGTKLYTIGIQQGEFFSNKYQHV